MKPGRELDALIAEKVMGLKRINDGFEQTNFEPVFEDGYRAKSYSTNISAAWEVVEKLQGRGFHFLMMSTSWKSTLCSFYTGPTDNRESAGPQETAPHAICLAALKVVGG